MADFRGGRSYTITELAKLARHGLKTYQGGITQEEAAKELNERFTPQRGEFRQSQVSMALKDPAKYPGMVMLLIEAFTDYRVNEQAKYTIERKITVRGVDGKEREF